MEGSPWIGAAILLAAFAYIPLSTLAATGSWARAWEAIRQYVKIMLGFVIVGGGFGLIMAISQHGLAAILGIVTGR